MQIFGMIASLTLIVAMGWLASLFTLGIIILCLVWFHYYARKRVVRDGAIYHWFARLGERVYQDLDVELRSILKEKGLRSEDPFEEVVAEADVLDLKPGTHTFESVMDQIEEIVTAKMPDRKEELATHFVYPHSIDAIEAVTSRFSWVPYPTTTTSESAVMSGLSTMSMTV